MGLTRTKRNKIKKKTTNKIVIKIFNKEKKTKNTKLDEKRGIKSSPPTNRQ